LLQITPGKNDLENPEFSVKLAKVMIDTVVANFALPEFRNAVAVLTDSRN
jgi:hypothetical protein